MRSRTRDEPRAQTRCNLARSLSISSAGCEIGRLVGQGGDSRGRENCKSEGGRMGPGVEGWRGGGGGDCRHFTAARICITIRDCRVYQSFSPSICIIFCRARARRQPRSESTPRDYAGRKLRRETRSDFAISRLHSRDYALRARLVKL